MTKDNQGDVDEVENALKCLKPGFKISNVKKQQQPSHQVLKSISSLGDESDTDCGKLREWTEMTEITWAVKNGSCMFFMADQKILNFHSSYHLFNYVPFE